MGVWENVSGTTTITAPVRGEIVRTFFDENAKNGNGNEDEEGGYDLGHARESTWPTFKTTATMQERSSAQTELKIQP